MRQGSFFEHPGLYERLDDAGDPLKKLDAFVDWPSLFPILAPLRYESGEKGGRPGLNPLMTVKCLILQALYNISDDSCEYQINDRLSFKRFLGLSPHEKAPDAKTIWLYRERVKHSGLHDKIFAWFSERIDEAGYVAKTGQMVDASFVPTHKPTGKHKKQLKEEIPLTPAQERQIDRDATFTKKGNVSYHGYKEHVNADARHKFIRNRKTTTASVHDSREIEDLLEPAVAEPAVVESDRNVFADSAYRSGKIEADIQEKGLISQVHERAYRNAPLTEAQKNLNKLKSRFRARIEHVFGHVENSMGGYLTHVVGLARVNVKMAFKAAAYNMQRFAMLQNRRAKCA